MNKKRFLYVASLVMLSVLFFGCGKASEQQKNIESSDEKKITIWAWDPAYNIAALEEAKQIYQKENKDVTIEIVDYAKADLEQKLHTNLASGQSEGLPDIVLIENLNAIKYLKSYPNAFSPLTKVINYDDFATSVDFMTMENKTYGLPFGATAAGMYYRTDYFKEAGFDDDDLNDITWDEFIEIGKKVKEKTGKLILTQDPDNGDLIRMMMQSAGVGFFNNDGELDIENNKIIKESVSQYKKLMESGIVKVNSGWNEMIGALNGGEVATIPIGCWITPSVKAEESQNGLWRVAPIPRLNIPESVNYTGLGGAAWYVINSDSKKELANDFLSKTFGSSVELYDTLLSEHGINSMFIPAFVSESYTQEQEFFDGQKIYSDFSEWSKEIKEVNFGMHTWEADAALMDELQGIMKGESIDKGLKNVQERVEQQIQ